MLLLFWLCRPSTVRPSVWAFLAPRSLEQGSVSQTGGFRISAFLWGFLGIVLGCFSLADPQCFERGLLLLRQPEDMWTASKAEVEAWEREVWRSVSKLPMAETFSGQVDAASDVFFRDHWGWIDAQGHEAPDLWSLLQRSKASGSLETWREVSMFTEHRGPKRVVGPLVFAEDQPYQLDCRSWPARQDLRSWSARQDLRAWSAEINHIASSGDSFRYQVLLSLRLDPLKRAWAMLLDLPKGDHLVKSERHEVRLKSLGEPQLFRWPCSEVQERLICQSPEGGFAFTLPAAQGHALQWESSLELQGTPLAQALDAFAHVEKRKLSLAKKGGDEVNENADVQWLFYGEGDDASVSALPSGLPRLIQSSHRLPYSYRHGALDWVLEPWPKFHFPRFEVPLVQALGHTLVDRDLSRRHWRFTLSEQSSLPLAFWQILLLEAFPSPEWSWEALADERYEEPLTPHRQSIDPLYLLLLGVGSSLACWRALVLLRA